MATKKGKFIILEGGDGAGKTSCRNFLQSVLIPKDFDFTKEPGGTESGDAIRSVLLTNREQKLLPFSELLLFMASRAEHIEHRIKPELAKGRNIICERFAPSSYVYQIVASDRKDLESTFIELNEKAVNNIEPDLCILLDVPPKIGLNRVRVRGGGIDQFEARDISFHEKVRKGYHDFVKRYKNVAIIDAAQAEDVVHKQVLDEIEKCLKQ
jgi:dTMP kinase